MRIVLLGAPGSGKGTQAAEISEKYKIPHISTGDIFRENIKNKTELGLKVKAIIDGGNLCPDDLTCKLIEDRLNKEDCKNGYLLDGFPRNIFQAEALDKFATPDMAIEIDVDFAKIERRITGRRSCVKCGGTFHIDNIGNVKTCPTCGNELIIRDDDNEKTVKHRLSVYAEQTAPLIDFYKKCGKLKTVDGNASVEEVFSNIVKIIGK